MAEVKEAVDTIKSQQEQIADYVSDSESKAKFKRLRYFWQAKAEPVISANNLPWCHSLCETNGQETEIAIG